MAQGIMQGFMQGMRLRQSAERTKLYRQQMQMQQRLMQHRLHVQQASRASSQIGHQLDSLKYRLHQQHPELQGEAFDEALLNSPEYTQILSQGGVSNIFSGLRRGPNTPEGTHRVFTGVSRDSVTGKYIVHADLVDGDGNIVSQGPVTQRGSSDGDDNVLEYSASALVGTVDGAIGAYNADYAKRNAELLKGKRSADYYRNMFGTAKGEMHALVQGTGGAEAAQKVRHGQEPDFGAATAQAIQNGTIGLDAGIKLTNNMNRYGEAVPRETRQYQSGTKLYTVDAQTGDVLRSRTLPAGMSAAQRQQLALNERRFALAQRRQGFAEDKFEYAKAHAGGTGSGAAGGAKGSDGSVKDQKAQAELRGKHLVNQKRADELLDNAAVVGIGAGMESASDSDQRKATAGFKNAWKTSPLHSEGVLDVSNDGQVQRVAKAYGALYENDQPMWGLGWFHTPKKNSDLLREATTMELMGYEDPARFESEVAAPMRTAIEDTGYTPSKSERSGVSMLVARLTNKGKFSRADILYAVKAGAQYAKAGHRGHMQEGIKRSLNAQLMNQQRGGGSIKSTDQPGVAAHASRTPR